MTVVVDLPAVRPARLAATLAVEDFSEHVRAFRALVRGARREDLPDGIRLVLALDLPRIAALAELVRAEADAMPYWRFRVLADPPACWLEVTGDGAAGDLARAVLRELATRGRQPSRSTRRNAAP